MKKGKVNLDTMKLVGVIARTNNKNEMNPEISKIAKIANTYWSQGTANSINHRKNPGVTYAVYTEYESDENGEYTYFLGEEVDSFEGQDESKFEQLTIPASNYQKFTTPSGKLPNVIIDAWQQIWQMTSSDFGGKRKYIADFEVCDQKDQDPNNTAIDIYIGIE